MNGINTQLYPVFTRAAQPLRLNWTLVNEGEKKVVHCFCVL